MECNRRRQATDLGSRQLSHPEQPVVRELFPMMVVTADVILALTEQRPFQELLKVGLVKRLAPDAIATFISHQWLTRSHPDPDGAQLRNLQRFLRTAQRGEIKGLFSERDWTTFKAAVNPNAGGIPSKVASGRRRELSHRFSRHGPNAPDGLLSEEVAQSFLWIDYLCVPQDLPPDDDSQLRAIRSIPYYVAQSSFFIVLCPGTQHSGADELSAYQSWLRRGWCRFEVWLNVLSHQRVAPLVLTDSQAWAIGVNDFFSYYGRSRGAVVGCGEFTCCRFGHRRIDGTPAPCDRESILPLMESMWRARVREASEAQTPWLYASLRIKETHFFAQSLDAPFHATWGDGSIDDRTMMDNDGTPELVLERIEADILAGQLPEGAQVICVAAELGDERLLEACVARGDDPMAVDSDGDSILRLACTSGSPAAVEYLLSLPSMTAEHVNTPNKTGRGPLRGGVHNERIVRDLLRCRAESAPCKAGILPLHVAARLGQDGAVRMLLAAGGPSVDAVDSRGMTALHHAAEGEGLFGCVQGRLRAMQCLLRHGASSAIRDRGGDTARDLAVRHGFRAGGDLIQDPGMRHSCWCD